MTGEAPADSGAPGALTEGTLLNGRVRYTQFAGGYRTGLEPVLLAASLPAAPGDHVLEAGTGAGAGLLCLAARVPGLTGLGLERDPALAALAGANLAANGHTGCSALRADLLDWQPEAVFDHAFANPPWHEAASTPSPDAGRRSAKRAAPGLLAAWVAAMARCLRRRGTLSLILPATSLAEGVTALTAAQCPEVTCVPLWPRAGEAARLIILRGVRLGRGPCAVAPGLVLHNGEGFSAAADLVLRAGAGL
jgi:tRNA1(Val) A37 N6-methylase TrmN6